MNYGYARSNLMQSLRVQVNLLKKENLDDIIIDRTGEKLSELIDSLKPGDSLHVTSPDRISRNTSLFVKIAERLINNDIGLYVGRNRIELYDVHLFGVVAEKYRKDTLKILENHKAWREKQKKETE